MELFHCFGARPEHRVDTDVAAAMLRASGCPYLAVNTHNIDTVDSGDDLPVGYASATLGSVRTAVSGVEPVLNINHPTSAAEAVDRTRRAVELTGIRIIKLEVLDDRFRTSRNDEVVRATEQLRSDGLTVWPLIIPDRDTFTGCVELGSAMVRVMGSPIGSRAGLAAERREAVEDILAARPVPVMLDGGIGSLDDVRSAGRLGFDSILVNSCLFGSGLDPVAELASIRKVVDDYPPSASHRVSITAVDSVRS